MIIKSEIDQWKKDMTELSKASNVFCKFSGILTEVGQDYTKEQLDPYIDFILNTFGSDKLMWGSDWPVLTMADNYSNWFKKGKVWYLCSLGNLFRSSCWTQCNVVSLLDV